MNTLVGSRLSLWLYKNHSTHTSWHNYYQKCDKMLRSNKRVIIFIIISNDYPVNFGTHTQSKSRRMREGNPSEVTLGLKSGWKRRSNRLLARKEFIRLGEYTRNKPDVIGIYEVGYDDGGNYQTPAATGGHRCWLAVGGCAERDDLMPGTAPPWNARDFQK